MPSILTSWHFSPHPAFLSIGSVLIAELQVSLLQLHMWNPGAKREEFHRRLQGMLRDCAELLGAQRLQCLPQHRPVLLGLGGLLGGAGDAGELTRGHNPECSFASC